MKKETFKFQMHRFKYQRKANIFLFIDLYVEYLMAWKNEKWQGRTRESKYCCQISIGHILYKLLLLHAFRFYVNGIIQAKPNSILCIQIKIFLSFCYIQHLKRYVKIIQLYTTFETLFFNSIYKILPNIDLYSPG